MIKFSVEGNPVPQGRPRFFRRGNHVGAYDPAKSRVWKKLVADTASAHGCKPLDGPLYLSAHFRIQRPKTMTVIEPHYKRPDIDNLIKALKDALTGICWHDDAQVCFLITSKTYSDTPGVDVEIK